METLEKVAENVVLKNNSSTNGVVKTVINIAEPLVYAMAIKTAGVAIAYGIYNLIEK